MVNTLAIQGNVASIELYMSQIVRAVERGNIGVVKPIITSALEHCSAIRSLLNESAHHVELVADLSKTVEPPTIEPAVEVPLWIAERWRTMESPPPTKEDGAKVGENPTVGEAQAVASPFWPENGDTIIGARDDSAQTEQEKT